MDETINDRINSLSRILLERLGIRRIPGLSSFRYVSCVAMTARRSGMRCESMIAGTI